MRAIGRRRQESWFSSDAPATGCDRPICHSKWHLSGNDLTAANGAEHGRERRNPRAPKPGKRAGGLAWAPRWSVLEARSGVVVGSAFERCRSSAVQLIAYLIGSVFGPPTKLVVVRRGSPVSSNDVRRGSSSSKKIAISI